MLRLLLLQPDPKHRPPWALPQFCRVTVTTKKPSVRATSVLLLLQDKTTFYLTKKENPFKDVQYDIWRRFQRDNQNSSWDCSVDWCPNLSLWSTQERSSVWMSREQWNNLLPTRFLFQKPLGFNLWGESHTCTSKVQTWTEKGCDSRDEGALVYRQAFKVSKLNKNGFMHETAPESKWSVIRS